MSSRRRVLVAGLWHETNTFSAVATRYEDFRAFQFAAGSGMLRYRDTNTEIGGMIAAADENGVELAFGLFAGAVPSGLIEAEAFRRLVRETVAAIAVAGEVDGAVLAIHGALVVADSPNAEAEWIAAVRKAIGPQKPVVATFDLHANLSQAVVDAADVLVGYDTFPHIDMAARGADAMRIVAEIMKTGERPSKAFRKLPLLTVPQTQGTEDQPANAIYATLRATKADPAIVSASVALGFPYSDRDDLGVAVVAYGERAAAKTLVDQVGGLIWHARRDFVAPLVEPAAAVATADKEPGPTVLVDVADNVGGGAPGDGTALLAALLAQPPASASVVIWDPQAVLGAAALGVGGRFGGLVGGKSDTLHGQSVPFEGDVIFAAPVRYQRQSSYMTGQEVDLGRVAVIRRGGIRLMLTERRAMPFDADHLRAAGIVPEEMKAIVVKSAIAWKAGFAQIAARSIFVDTPGTCSSNLKRFTYTRGAASLFPLNAEAAWP